MQVGIPNQDNYFQTMVSGLYALKPGFRVQVRVLQLWRVEDKRTKYTACIVYKWENCVKMHSIDRAEERMIPPFPNHHSPVIAHYSVVQQIQ